MKNLLSTYDQAQVGRFIKYCAFLKDEIKPGTNVKKNPWMSHRTPEQLADYFKAVVFDNMIFDCVHITLNSHGVSYDYVAYKRKMLTIYPESLIDVQLVHEGDTFKFLKEAGSVIYKHEIIDAFGKNKEIVGGYCVIKNKRGEFLTTLNYGDFEKHRKVAKTDYIWLAWYAEMFLKTLIKKACKQHFADEYQNIETLDNEQYDLDNSLELPIETKQDLEKIKTVPELEKYYKLNAKKHAGIVKEFIKSCATRKAQIVEELSNENL